jgi:hypothetical protein
MTPIVAHHAGEDSLLNLLVFGGSWLSLAAVLARARLAAASQWLVRIASRGRARRGAPG